MSAEKYPTLSLVMPSVQTLLTSLKPKETDCAVIKIVKQAMGKDLQTSYKDEQETFTVCIIP